MLGGLATAVVLGGAIVGLGISLMHYTGMKALLAEGHIEWDLAVAGTPRLRAALASAATPAFHASRVRSAIAAGAGLLTLAFADAFHGNGCCAHRARPNVVADGFSADASILALAIAGLTVLVMVAGLAAAVIDRQTRPDSVERIRELVDAASEGIVIAADGIIVNVNRRVTELCGHLAEDLIG